MGKLDGTGSLSPSASNHPVERTAHSAGSVLRRGSVPVGRRSPGALEGRTYVTTCMTVFVEITGAQYV
jgi:hypothetical protein